MSLECSHSKCLKECETCCYCGRILKEMKKSYPDTCLELAERATSGPWVQDGAEQNEGHIISLSKTDNPIPYPHICSMSIQWKDHYKHLHNAEFIAFSRTALPELARRLKLAVETIMELHDELTDHYNRNKCPKCKLLFKDAEEVMEELEKCREDEK